MSSYQQPNVAGQRQQEYYARQYYYQQLQQQQQRSQPQLRPSQQQQYYNIAPATARQPSSSYQPSTYQANNGYSSEENAYPSPPSDEGSPSSPSETKQRPFICMYRECCDENGPKAFARFADLQRHAQRVHHGDPILYDCPMPGCDRSGSRGLPRRDKLTEHLREKHKLAIPKVGRTTGRRSS